jgi:hypothetical protein
LKHFSKKKIIYLVNYPFSEQDVKKNGIQNWINHGWNVEIFDITSFTYPKFWRSISRDKLYVNLEGVTIFKNINEILLALNNLQDKVVFIDSIGWSKEEMNIRSTASAHGLILSVMSGSIPKPKNNKNYMNSLSLIKTPIVFVNKLIGFFKTLVKKNRIKKYNPDYTVVSGSSSLSEVNNKKTKIIKAHNFDYDVFIQEKQIKSNKDSNSLVFLDETTSYSTRSGLKPYVTADNYFPMIDHCLYQIAKSLNLNIKIAAHPRSNLGIEKIKYNHSIFKNKTFELIRDANVVVGHSSSSLQWAVIMKKPIILLTTDEIQNEYYGKPWAKLIDSFATILGKKVINLNNISNIIDFSDYLNVNHEKYEKYIETYVKTKGSPEKLSWEIIIEHIERDLFI